MTLHRLFSDARACYSCTVDSVDTLDHFLHNGRGVMFASKSEKLLKLIHLSFLYMTMRAYVAPLCLHRLLTYRHTRTLFRTVDHI